MSVVTVQFPSERDTSKRGASVEKGKKDSRTTATVVANVADIALVAATAATNVADTDSVAVTIVDNVADPALVAATVAANVADPALVAATAAASVADTAIVAATAVANVADIALVAATAAANVADTTLVAVTVANTGHSHETRLRCSTAINDPSLVIIDLKYVAFSYISANTNFKIHSCSYCCYLDYVPLTYALYSDRIIKQGELINVPQSLREHRNKGLIRLRDSHPPCD